MKFVSNIDYEEISQFKEMVSSVNPDIIALFCVESADEVLKAKKDLGVKSSHKVWLR